MPDSSPAPNADDAAARRAPSTRPLEVGLWSMGLAVAVVTVLVAVLMGVPAVGQPADAPPANDTVSAASPLQVGQRVTQDTTAATSDALESDLNPCSSLPQQAGVWFSFTPTTSLDQVRLDLSDSTYGLNMVVFKDEAEMSADHYQACSEGALLPFPAEVGHTYLILVSGWVPDQHGGILSGKLEAPPFTPNVRIHSIDPDVRLQADHRVRVTVLTTCTNASIAEDTALITRRRGNLTRTLVAHVTGHDVCDGSYSRTFIRSDPVRHPRFWSTGRGRVRLVERVSGIYGCVGASQTRSVRLRPDPVAAIG